MKMSSRCGYRIFPAAVLLGVWMTPLRTQSEEQSHRAYDVIQDSQTPREIPASRPEQTKNEHDKSNVFKSSNADPSSPAFQDQPEQGQTQGFDFYRDPLDAKKPMQTFDEIMQADMEAKSKVMETQRKLLESRYDLTPHLDPETKMFRGKPLAVGRPPNFAMGYLGNPWLKCHPRK